MFVGKDDAGQPRSAFLRGCGGTFRGDVAGSQKQYGFLIGSDVPASDAVEVYEAPIDALSGARVATLYSVFDMGLTSEYVGTLGHDTPAISRQFSSAVTPTGMLAPYWKPSVKGDCSPLNSLYFLRSEYPNCKNAVWNICINFAAIGPSARRFKASVTEF